MQRTNTLNQRSFKVRKNLSGSTKLYKAALRKKKEKWAFLLTALERDSFQSFDIFFEEHSTLQRLSRAFALQWKDKQSLKAHYIMKNEKSWKFFIKRAKRWRSRPSLDFAHIPYSKDIVTFLILWESRLDISLWKSSFYPSLSSARQAVKQGRISVEGKTVRSPNRLLRAGELVSVKKAMPSNIKGNTFTPQPIPNHLEVHFTSHHYIFIDKPEIQALLWPFPLGVINPR